jgi:hypothetical protein
MINFPSLSFFSKTWPQSGHVFGNKEKAGKFIFNHSQQFSAIEMFWQRRSAASHFEK